MTRTHLRLTDLRYFLLDRSLGIGTVTGSLFPRQAKWLIDNKLATMRHGRLVATKRGHKLYEAELAVSGRRSPFTVRPRQGERQ
jgi:hypothetical protein